MLHVPLIEAAVARRFVAPLVSSRLPDSVVFVRRQQRNTQIYLDESFPRSFERCVCSWRQAEIGPLFRPCGACCEAPHPVEGRVQRFQRCDQRPSLYALGCPMMGRFNQNMWLTAITKFETCHQSSAAIA